MKWYVIVLLIAALMVRLHIALRASSSEASITFSL
jgi:hypothetical protein